MKKLVSLFILAVISIAIPANAQTAQQTTPAPNIHKMQMKKEFEQRLNLSDKQKQKAKIIHQNGRERMKPVVEQIIEKKKEVENVKLSKMSESAQQEKIEELNAQIRELEKQAHEIRKENSREFENILNKKQKNELAKMKAEGRAKFEKNHPPRPPFSGLGPNGFFSPKPLFHNPQSDFTSK